jgi:DnaJ like chaperone protein
MGLLGALFGGSIGFMFGGPLGAMIGGAIGASSGNGTAQGRRFHGGAGAAGGGFAGARAAGAHGYRTAQEAQSAFLVALISLAAKVSKADGKVSPAEIQTFDNFLRDNMQMPAEERKMASRIFNQARDSSVPATDFARQIRGILGGHPERLRDLITLLLQIGHADGTLDTAEEKLIREIAFDMGLSDRDYNECKALFGASGVSVSSAYEALGLDASASDQEVKKAYRGIAKEYHPDVLASKGLPDDFTKFAKEKLQKVNAAYDQIKKERGF